MGKYMAEDIFLDAEIKKEFYYHDEEFEKSSGRNIFFCPYHKKHQCGSKVHGKRIYFGTKGNDSRYCGTFMEKHFKQNKKCEKQRCWDLSVLSLKGMELDFSKAADRLLFQASRWFILPHERKVLPKKETRVSSLCRFCAFVINGFQTDKRSVLGHKHVRTGHCNDKNEELCLFIETNAFVTNKGQL